MLSSSRLQSSSYTFTTIPEWLSSDVNCNIAIYDDGTTLYSKCDQASDLWQQPELASELSSELLDTVDCDRKWPVDFNVGKTQLILFDQSNIDALVLLIWKWIELFLMKNHLLRSWGWLSLLNWIGALILSLLLNLSARKLEPWLVLWSLFLLRFLCISINIPYSHVYQFIVDM